MPDILSPRSFHGRFGHRRHVGRRLDVGWTSVHHDSMICRKLPVVTSRLWRKMIKMCQVLRNITRVLQVCWFWPWTWENWGDGQSSFAFWSSHWCCIVLQLQTSLTWPFEVRLDGFSQGGRWTAIEMLLYLALPCSTVLVFKRWSDRSFELVRSATWVSCKVHIYQVDFQQHPAGERRCQTKCCFCSGCSGCSCVQFLYGTCMDLLPYGTEHLNWMSEVLSCSDWTVDDCRYPWAAGYVKLKVWSLASQTWFSLRFHLSTWTGIVCTQQLCQDPWSLFRKSYRVLSGPIGSYRVLSLNATCKSIHGCKMMQTQTFCWWSPSFPIVFLKLWHLLVPGVPGAQFGASTKWRMWSESQVTQVTQVTDSYGICTAYAPWDTLGVGFQQDWPHGSFFRPQAG